MAEPNSGSKAASAPVAGNAKTTGLRRIIPREEFASLEQARGLYQTAKEQAEQIVEDARLEARSIVEEARREADELLAASREQAQAEARQEQVQRLIEFVDGAVRHVQELEGGVAAIVGDALERLLDERGDEARIRALVKRMLRGLEQDERIRVNVSESLYPKAESALSELMRRWPRLSLCSAEGLSGDRLVLECSVGVVEADLSEQVANLRKAMATHLGQADSDASESDVPQSSLRADETHEQSAG